MGEPLLLAAATLIATAVATGYVALGGGSYTPLRPANPCVPRLVRPASSFNGVAQQLVLSALDGAACRLGVSREELTLALATASSRTRFAGTHGVREPALEAAVRHGIERAATDAQQAGELTAAQTSIIEVAIAALPIAQLIAALQTGSGLGGTIAGLLRQ